MGKQTLKGMDMPWEGRIPRLPIYKASKLSGPVRFRVAHKDGHFHPPQSRRCKNAGNSSGTRDMPPYEGVNSELQYHQSQIRGPQATTISGPVEAPSGRVNMTGRQPAVQTWTEVAGKDIGWTHPQNRVVLAEKA
jgi:hypothetical protein